MESNNSNGSSKKSWNKKTIGAIAIGTSAAILTMYAGDAINLKQNVSDGYHASQDFVVDTFTKDIGEESQEYIAKLEESDDDSLYVQDITAAMGASFEALDDSMKQESLAGLLYRLPDSLAARVINSRTDSMQAKYQANVAGNASKELVKDGGNSFWEGVKNMYDSLEVKVKGMME